MSSDKEEKLIRELMGKSVAKMPFSDFEDKLMEQIHRGKESSRSLLKDIKLSWFFFVVGTVFGLVISIVVGQMQGTIFGYPAQRVLIIAQAVFVVFALSQFDRLIGLAGNNSGKQRNIPLETEESWHE